MANLDLHYPTTWQERVPYLQEQVLFVPDYYFGHEKFSMPSFKEIFDNSNPVCLEFCSGNGQWIIEKAERHPELNWVAVEWQLRRAKKIYAKMKRRGLKNLFVVAGEGLTFSKYYLETGSVNHIYVNFPDPWPKDRHAKHRLIQVPFVEESSRTLAEEGTVTLVTDHPLYANQMITCYANHDRFTSLFKKPYYQTHLDDYGSSFFDSLWRGKGETIHYMRFQKCTQTPTGS